MKVKTVLGAAASAFLLCTSGAYAACDKMEKVTAVWLPIMQTTAYYVALEEKLFEKACIEVVSTKMEAPNQIIDALIADLAGTDWPDEKKIDREKLLELSARVAAASGGILGLGSKISSEEQALLDRLATRELRVLPSPDSSQTVASIPVSASGV